MSKFIVGLIVGAILGWLLTSSKKAPLLPIPSEPVAIDSPPQKQVPQPRKQVLETRKPAKIVVEEKEVLEKKLANIDITDEQVTEMEQHLSQLQSEVSLYREDRGWKVRYHIKDNIFAHTGLQDDDLIRYDQIEMLRQDPSKSELMARFENIIQNLQR